MSHPRLVRESRNMPLSHRRSWSNLAPFAPLLAFVAAIAGCPETREEPRSSAVGNAAVNQTQPQPPPAKVTAPTANNSGAASVTTPATNELHAGVSQVSTNDNKSDGVAGSTPIVDQKVAQTSGTTNDQASDKSSSVKTTVHANAPKDDGTYGDSHVDPVKLNGPIFVDWPKPKLALLFSGAQQGYIEPCGCAGLENQKGGLSRRHELMKKLRRRLASDRLRCRRTGEEIRPATGTQVRGEHRGFEGHGVRRDHLRRRRLAIVNR